MLQNCSLPCRTSLKQHSIVTLRTSNTLPATVCLATSTNKRRRKPAAAPGPVQQTPDRPVKHQTRDPSQRQMPSTDQDEQNSSSSEDLKPVKPTAKVKETKPQINFKVIGLGAKGINSVNQLANSGLLNASELWAIDTDKKVLASAAESVQRLEPAADADVIQLPTELTQMTAQHQVKTRAPGPAGIAFVVGSATGCPGGVALLQQLISQLKRQGHFVVTTLTSPFSFEGPRKREQADAAIKAVEAFADLLVVVDQDVLMHTASNMTMAQASSIADDMLLHTVTCVANALTTQDVLHVANEGAAPTKAMTQTLLMSLLASTRHGHLGRGQAALLSHTGQGSSLAGGLLTSAGSAVRSAAGSPFLEGQLAYAKGVLCIVRVPKHLVEADNPSPRRPGRPSKRASSKPAIAEAPLERTSLKSVAQVAADKIKQLVGPGCQDIIVCMQAVECQQTLTSQSSPPAGVLAVDCDLLVLNAVGEHATAASGALDSIDAANPGGKPLSPRRNRSSLSPPVPPQKELLVTNSRARTSRPNSNAAEVPPLPPRPIWQALSTVAGGSPAPYSSPARERPNDNYASLHNDLHDVPPSSDPVPVKSLVESLTKAAHAVAKKARSETPDNPIVSIGLVSQTVIEFRRSRSRSNSASIPATPKQSIAHQVRLSTALESNTAKQVQLSMASAEQIIAMQSRLTSPEQLVSSVASRMSTTLAQIRRSLSPPEEALTTHQGHGPATVALDLPPGAAKWRRHQQKGTSASSTPTDSTLHSHEIETMMAEFKTGDSNDTDGDTTQGNVQDLRSRVAGMLEKERQLS